jgi:alkanesulfonate monooxygenase SsuD/methylene tetrahydromethanopterin reductase-like flavin-dependent oxidoreductase (luciferase family)
MSPQDSAERAKFFERCGFYSVWLSDETIVFNSPPDLVVPELFPTLALVSAATKKARVGTGVIDAGMRHPAKTAQSIATVDSLSGGRLLVGIGGGEVGNHELFGIPTDHPFGRMEEVVKIQKLLLGSSHEKPVSFSGRFYSMSGAYLKVKPVTKPHPPIIISAFGPNALRLAAEQGDGWLSFSHTPKSFSQVLNGPIRQNAQRAKRTLTMFETTMVVPIALSSNEKKAASVVAPIAKDWLVWSPDNMKLVVPEVDQPRMRQPYAKSNRPEAIKELAALAAKIPDEAVLDTTAHGNASHCTEQLLSFSKAGCKHIVLYFLAVEQSWSETVREFSRKVLPHL